MNIWDILRILKKRLPGLWLGKGFLLASNHFFDTAKKHMGGNPAIFDKPVNMSFGILNVCTLFKQNQKSYFC